MPTFPATTSTIARGYVRGSSTEAAEETTTGLGLPASAINDVTHQVSCWKCWLLFHVGVTKYYEYRYTL